MQTPHLQGYVEFKIPLNDCLARQVLETRRLWIRPATANRESNKRYCTKTRDRIGGPWSVNNSKKHRRRVAEARARAGRASGVKRKELGREDYIKALEAELSQHRRFAKAFKKEGWCPTCGNCVLHGKSTSWKAHGFDY